MIRKRSIRESQKKRVADILVLRAELLRAQLLVVKEEERRAKEKERRAQEKHALQMRLLAIEIELKTKELNKL